VPVQLFFYLDVSVSSLCLARVGVFDEEKKKTLTICGSHLKQCLQWNKRSLCMSPECTGKRKGTKPVPFSMIIDMAKKLDLKMQPGGLVCPLCLPSLKSKLEAVENPLPDVVLDDPKPKEISEQLRSRESSLVVSYQVCSCLVTN
jgi:hypothetical protein